MSTFWATMAVLLFVSALVGGGVFLFTHRPRIALPQEELSIQTVRAIILTKLQNVRELAMVRSNFQSVVHFEEAKKVFGHDVPGTMRKFMLSYTGTVVCGCDLNKVNVGNSFFNRNHLQITLPQSRIFDIYPDLSTVKLHDQDAGIFADDIKIEEQNREITAELQDVKERLINEGILLKSNDNVQQLVRSITAPLGIEAVIAFDNSESLNGQSEPLRLN